MDFSNQTVSPEDLPSIEAITFHPLEKDYLLVERISFFLGQAIFIAIAVPVFLLVDPLQDAKVIFIVLALFLILSVLSFVSTGLSFKFSGYALRDRDLLFRSGWLKRRIRIVVRNRIQHVSVQSGPIERKFGLSSVSIFTAGSSEADFTIKGIKEQTALGIKEWIGKS
jgi:membrane protein YdbS with pleckstrin-like domain